MAEPARIGVTTTISLPDGRTLAEERWIEVKPASEEAGDVDESVPAAELGYAFSGRHDHGVLPPMKTGGPYGALLEAVEAARAFSDAALTEVIESGGLSVEMPAELPREAPSTESLPSPKRIRVD
eukprot:PLAT7809.1.p1 GENE.PLAT7809.1~~PLAT7809.1.p1  ORF type:complete len:135 (-),score=17.43 PLAT7809.1:108-482(-)